MIYHNDPKFSDLGRSSCANNIDQDQTSPEGEADVCHSVCIFYLLTYEPPHDKTNKFICAPTKDSDQPGHQSLRSVLIG